MFKIFFSSLLLLVFFTSSLQAQHSVGKLPWAYYMTMTHNCNSADIVLLHENGSINIDAKNIGIIEDMIENTAAQKTESSPTATIMCLRDGREFISGKIFITGDRGFVSFNVDGKEYVNQLSERGIRFFRSMDNL